MPPIFFTWQPFMPGEQWAVCLRCISPYEKILGRLEEQRWSYVIRGWDKEKNIRMEAETNLTEFIIWP